MKKVLLLCVILLPVLVLASTMGTQLLTGDNGIENSITLGDAVVDSIKEFMNKLDGIGSTLEKLYDTLNLFDKDRTYGGYTLLELNKAFKWEFDNGYMNYFQFIWTGLKWNRFTFKETTDIEEVWNWNENNPIIYPSEEED